MQGKKRCCACKKPLEDTLEYNIQDFICPSCGQHYADKPIQEAIFFVNQDKFFKEGDQDAFGIMLLQIREFSYNLICKRLKNSAVYISEDEIEDKVSWCVLKCINLYRDPLKEFRISASLTGYLNQMVIYPLYNAKDQERDQLEISLFTPLKGKKDDKRQMTLLDKLSEETYLEGHNELENFMYRSVQIENVIDQLKDFLGSLLGYVLNNKGYAQAIKISILYASFFEDAPNEYFNVWWNNEGHAFRDYFEKTLVALKRSLKDIGDC